MNKILILFAHPAFKRSTINAALRDGIEGEDGITIHDLYGAYPDFFIDVDHEQGLCEAHDIIIFQHPFYWYSTPAILKEWLDLVLEHGWAYGSQGNALAGKYTLQAITAGGDGASYRTGGTNGHTIGELISPYRATASLCGMHWLPPFVVLGVHRGLPGVIVNGHVERYRQAIIALRDGRVNYQEAARHEYLNSNLKAIIREP
jgi:glutathione-regulated potassium-efflux system ancillary protein KefG